MLTLYGHGSRTAANILKLRAALAEVGAQYSYSIVDLSKGEQHSPHYLAINPHGKVPVLVDDDFSLPESDAILWYLAEKYPQANLLPQDMRGRARVLQWCDFASASLYVQSYDLYLHTTGFEPQNRSSFVEQRARTALLRSLGVLEGRLSGRRFVATEQLTIADFAVASVIHMLRTREQIDRGAYPNIQSHYDTISARASFQAALGDTP